MRTESPLVPESPDDQDDQGRQDTLWHFDEMAADKPREHSAYRHLLEFCHMSLLKRERGHYWESLQDETLYYTSFDLRDVMDRQWSDDQGKFSLNTLLRLCGRIVKTQLGSDEKALVVTENKNIFRYRFCRAVIQQWDEQGSAEEESDAQESAPSNTQPIDPASPINPKFDWAMSLNRNAATTSLFQAASVLQTVAQKTAHSANAGSDNVQQYLRRVQDRIQELVSWATDIDAPNRGPYISDDDDEELIDPRKVRRANATQTNVRDSEPKEHINATYTSTSSHAKPTVPPLNATKPSNTTKRATGEPTHLPNYPPRGLDGVKYPQKKEGIVAIKLWNTTAGKQVLQNRKLTGGDRVVFQCAESLEKGVLKPVSKDQLQCPYKAVLQKNKPKGGSEHWALVGGGNAVYEHKHCGGSAKPTTKELVRMQTSCTAVKANRGVSG